MSTSKTDLDRYALTIDGVRWEYDGTQLLPWRLDTPSAGNFRNQTDTMLALSAPKYASAILSVVQRWHEDFTLAQVRVMADLLATPDEPEPIGGE